MSVRLRQQYQAGIAQDTDISSYANNTDAPRRIIIRHPGYPDEHNTLFNLLAPDTNSTTLKHGLCHSLILIACGIVAGNSYDGYLSLQPYGPEIQEGENDVLKEEEYYFCLPTTKTTYSSSETSGKARSRLYPALTNRLLTRLVIARPPLTSTPASPSPSTSTLVSPSTPAAYPIYSCFDDWPFPHGRLPRYWRGPSQPRPNRVTRSYPASACSQAVTARDGACRLTDTVESFDVAHVIPKTEDTWFGRNDMNRYSSDPSSTTSVNDMKNCLLLRTDVHRQYDAFKWVIAPKATSADTSNSSTCWVFHLLHDSPELAKLYHNVPLQPIPGISAEYLLAGFAKAIFPMLGPFLQNRVPRFLYTKVGSSRREKWVDGQDLAFQFPIPGCRSRTQSQSPSKKRPATKISGDDEAADCDNMTLGRRTPPLDIAPEDRNSGKRKRSRSVSQQQIDRAVEARLSSSKRLQRWSACDIVVDQRNPFYDECTCEAGPVEIPTLSQSDQSETARVSNFQFCASKFCRRLEEARKMGRLRRSALEAERAKSGTGSTWEELQEWANTVTVAGLRSENVEEWWWVQGLDVRDSQI
jgi:hypothetical protein